MTPQLFKRTMGYVGSAMGGGLAAAASMVALLGYRGPTSFPIIHGIDIGVCAPSGDYTPTVAQQRELLDDLEKHKRQLVFISDLTIYGWGCWDAPERSALF